MEGVISTTRFWEGNHLNDQFLSEVIGTTSFNNMKKHWNHQFEDENLRYH